jgi:hypothetical protein
LYLVQPTTDTVARVETSFRCQAGHTFSKVFAADVKSPETWDCPHCGGIGTCESLAGPGVTPAANRTHWDMILERRSLDELADMVTERLSQLRAA